MKQTAIEWLMEEMSRVYIFDQTDFDLFKQAKAMEKQQIIEARVNAPLLNTESKYDYVIEAEQYYNETFKK